MIPRQVETEARRRWEAREALFPAFARQRWEQGTALARALMVVEAADALGIDLESPPPDPPADDLYA